MSSLAWCYICVAYSFTVVPGDEKNGRVSNFTSECLSIATHGKLNSVIWNNKGKVLGDNTRTPRNRAGFRDGLIQRLRTLASMSLRFLQLCPSSGAPFLSRLASLGSYNRQCLSSHLSAPATCITSELLPPRVPSQSPEGLSGWSSLGHMATWPEDRITGQA